MFGIRAAVLYFGALNLLLGLASLFGPLVAGGNNGPVNLETGQLFGLIAVNWAGALVLLAVGLYGLYARHTQESALTYFWVVAAVFGLLALLGLLAHARWLRVGGADGTPLIFQIAENWATTVLYLVWTGIGLLFALHARGRVQQPENQPTGVQGAA